MSKNFDSDSVPVSQVLSNTTVKAALGFGDNVRAISESGVELSSSTHLYDGDSVTIETRANQKA